MADTTWVAYYKKAVADLGGPDKCKPSSGRPCALASLRLVRDQILADMSKEGKILKDCAPAEAHIRATIGAMWEAIKKDGPEEGFLSNASAAAKAAGFKSEAEKVLDVAA